jgi:alpha-glucan phosphorylase-like protein
MSEQNRLNHAKERLLSADVEEFDSLAELALDMRSSWNHATDQVWRQLDRVLWGLTQNPSLTLGFARGFATYKRPNLLLHDPERLLHLLTNSERPVQLVIAGKARPSDQAGQALIQEWMHFIGQPEVGPHVIFLSDYDMLLTEHLMQGVDVWINTPRRPWEACGTSGMKVLVNGGINLSELDGWVRERPLPDRIGVGIEHQAQCVRRVFMDQRTEGRNHHTRNRAVTHFELKCIEKGKPASHLCRRDRDVRPDRGRAGHSRHSSHGLQGHVSETGFVRIVE